MGVELVELNALLGESDFITIHLPKNKETRTYSTLNPSS